MKKSLFLFFGIAVTMAALSAQEDFVPVGGDASSATGSFSYSVGQVVYDHDASGLDGSVNEGVQQPYVITNMGVENAHVTTLDVKLFPNPTTDYLNLSVSADEFESLNLEVYDLYGKCVLKMPVNASLTSISLQSLANATYILNVYDHSAKIKSFQIIKQ